MTMLCPDTPASLRRGIAVRPLQLPRRWGTTLFMVVIHLLAVVALMPRFWSWQAGVVLLVLYWLTACIGVTLGYHRLLAHGAFAVPRWLEALIATCGTLSCQHGPIDWVGLHRHHHLHSDDPADHHNSHLGFWWSHFGWMLRDIPAQHYVRQLTPDLQEVPYYRWLNSNFLLLQVPLAVLLFLLGRDLGVGGLGPSSLGNSTAPCDRLPRHLVGEFRNPSLGLRELSQWRCLSQQLVGCSFDLWRGLA